MIDNSSGDDLPQRDNDDDGAEERAEEDEAEKCGYVWGEEEDMEWGTFQVGVLLVNLGEDDWSHGNFALEGSLLGVLVIGDLAGHGGGELGGADESHDVGVVLEDEDLLVEGSVIVGAGSDSDN